MDKLQTLKKYFGHSGFREGQEPIVDSLLNGHDAVGIMPTGAGKSVCYQLPAVMMDGVSIVISPLISLMKDQVNSLNQTGIPAAYLNSSLTDRQFRIALSRAYNGAYKIIYVAPERLETAGFMKLAESIHISMITIDEAHCISQWGQDFRPGYLKIRDFIDCLSYRPVIGAFTATATSNVRNDIINILKLDKPKVVTTGFDRQNLYFGVEHPKDKMTALARLLKKYKDRSGIVYCSTRKSVEEVCSKLRHMGYEATRYHAGLEDEEKILNQEDFLYDRKTVMVATNAFGMGIDKSNVSFVIHYNMPKDLESYYQEAGRAGRDGEEAECILLYSKKDVRTAQWLIDNGTPNELLSDEQRENIHLRDKERLKQMTFYSTTGRCLRQYILNYFGDRRSCTCGKCSSCCPEKQIEPRNAAPKNINTDIYVKNSGIENDYGMSEWKARQAAKKPAPQTPFTAKDEELFAKLKQLRTQKAKVAGVPAFVIFSDAALRDMCRKRPVTKAEFLEVSGVGQTKAERYGKAFIEEIKNFQGDK
ncbi:MAG: RecQ family ATP-dependent DNA helicase [bacterium]|nr:RecQ family ATP-dependent DNA helicase [bacterium]